jgi:SAM-dependent methyltransferase
MSKILTEKQAEAAAGTFVCVCCRSSDSLAAGHYAIPNHDGSAFGYPLRTCHNCGHTQAHPFPAEKSIHDYYSGNFWGEQGVEAVLESVDWKTKVTQTSGLKERYERAARQFRTIEATHQLLHEAHILDVGSGYSPFLQICREKGYNNLYALDPAKDVCKYLQEQDVTTYAQLLEDFVSRTDLPKFDVIVLSHTAEHLFDPVTILKDLATLLKAGGVLYVDVPYRDHEKPFHLGLHLNFFSEKSLELAMERAGLTPVAVIKEIPNLRERLVQKLLFKIYGRFFGKGRITKGGHKLDRLHSTFWVPFRQILRLRINIFISSFDLKAVARRQQ